MRKTKKQSAIGIDLGGTNLRVALVSSEGEIKNKIKVSSTKNLEENLVSSVKELSGGGISGIGIGVAGLIDRTTGTVSVSPNLPAIEKTDIVKTLKNKFKIPVFIENDANVAALGEKWLGAGKEFENFVLLTLGTGIGSGIIYAGKLMNVAAEIGHMSIIAKGERCACGNHGCLEIYASARAIIANTIRALENGSESLLRNYYNGNIYKLTPEDIYKAAMDGDKLSRETLREAGRELGAGIANVINIFSPEAVILSGGLKGAWNLYIQEAIKEAARRSFKQLSDKVKIIPSSLNDNAGLLGAAYLVFSNE